MSLDLISPRTFVKPPRASAFLFIFLLLIACKKNDYQVTPAFYHWQTHFELSPEEQSLLDSLQVEKLYVKFFDVDWDFQQQEALPLAQVRFRQDSIPYQIIPTVFITNRTLEHLSVEAPDTLAARIYKQIKKLSNKVTLEEVQIDCDWTQSTKNKYFRLLKALRKQVPDSTQLQATIRLHQVKYARQTGVPPVDRGMLMFYNVGDVEDWYTENSILDLETARQYLQNFQRYPLPLDMALPLFSWGVLFRQGKMINLISQLEPEELADTGRFEKIGAHRYEVIESN